VIAWRSTSGAPNAGTVRFEPVSHDRTLVRLIMEYEPQGTVEKTGDAVGVFSVRVQNTVEDFKKYIENRGSRPSSSRAPARRQAVNHVVVGEMHQAVGDPGRDIQPGKGQREALFVTSAGTFADSPSRKSPTFTRRSRAAPTRAKYIRTPTAKVSATSAATG